MTLVMVNELDTEQQEPPAEYLSVTFYCNKLGISLATFCQMLQPWLEDEQRVVRYWFDGENLPKTKYTCVLRFYYHRDDMREVVRQWRLQKRDTIFEIAY